MPVPETIADWEELGRGIYSRSAAKRASRNRTPYSVFLPPTGEISISVDRLSVASLGEAIGIARRRSANREGEFRGWATVSVDTACKDDRSVVASPIEGENPYHADIVLPAVVVSDRKMQKHHALALARYSSWREDPNAV